MNTMEKCQQVQELLSDYRTGILSSRKAELVEEHVRRCEECANELRVLDDVLALVEDNIPDSEPPAGLWNGVYNRITSPETERRPSLWRWATRPVQAAGVGVAALALALGLLLSGGPQNSAVPVASASNADYVQGHALYAGQAPLADRIGYLSVVAASYDTTSGQESK